MRREAFKAYIHGQMISYTSSISNKQHLKLLELEQDVKELIEINLNDTTEIRQRAQHNELSSNKVLNSIMKLKQTFYDQGERAGKLLAWRLGSMQSERSILEIKSQLLIHKKLIVLSRHSTPNCICQKVQPQLIISQLPRSDINTSTDRGRKIQMLRLGIVASELSEAIDSMKGGKPQDQTVFLQGSFTPDASYINAWSGAFCVGY